MMPPARHREQNPKTLAAVGLELPSKAAQMPENLTSARNKFAGREKSPKPQP